jgi:hypothetical protein
VPLLERLPSLVDLVLVEAVLLDRGADLVLLHEVEGVREALVGDDGGGLERGELSVQSKEGGKVSEEKGREKKEERTARTLLQEEEG